MTNYKNVLPLPGTEARIVKPIALSLCQLSCCGLKSIDFHTYSDVSAGISVRLAEMKAIGAVGRSVTP